MGPLAGLRVIELASIGPGPMCAMLLADQGARVVRIDRLEPSGLGVPVDTRFDVTGRGRQSVAIDLRRAEGRDAALRLIDQADVLIEGWRPGVAERLGLGPEACHARNPGLVYGRMTGFGQSGPLAKAAGHDLNYIALTGALQAIGPAAQSLPPLNLVGDYGGGALYLAFGLMAALFERQTSGRGQVVDAAMVDGASSLLSIFHGLAAAGQWNTQQRQANLLDGGAPFYACYDTADGLQVSLAALEPKFFAEFVRLSGLDAAWVPRQYDRRHWPALREAIAALLRSRPRAEWCALLEGSDACFAPVLTLQQAAQHPHAAARGAFIDIGGVAQPAPAPRFSRSQAAPPGPPVAAGADTERVLAETGFAPHEIEALRRSGAIAGACA
ncbi:CaiB/BaiF CoA transferase family protein [Aquabacterium sp.]|uniref:CaiB/BaiF CoA transferase family protein n=1 Tax=Aquabacterium sp. TaxID=1872578 RepID=UPI0037842001